MNKTRSIGICIGASTIKSVELQWNNNNFTISKTSIISHNCNPEKYFLNQIKKFKVDSNDYISITGKRFKEYVNLSSITELEATEYALKSNLKKNKYNALLSLGSETFILYELDDDANIINVQTGNQCASGTGEFFTQQIKRMNIDLRNANNLANDNSPYKVSGRCSVFCKSDCTHALNIGVSAGSVCAGLQDMIANKAIELLQNVKSDYILVTGGVVKNSYIVKKISEQVKNLSIEENADVFEALGAAIYAYKAKKKFDNIKLIKNLHNYSRHLPIKKLLNKVTFLDYKKSNLKQNDQYIIGLDVGSTTTKALLINKYNDIIFPIYLRTKGNPIESTKQCLIHMMKNIDLTKNKIIGFGVTGSGRVIASSYSKATCIINEIIAHAAAAAHFDKDVDTIIEIGGQDAKYTYLINGVPCDYAMNDACAAGTGSFLEEALHENFNIKYLDIEKIAFKSNSPVNFNEQCAAFIGSDIKNASSENISKEDIVAGVVYSICMNYNNRVRGSRKFGKKIFMQGGVCYNKAVPFAMSGVINKDIIVPPYPGMMGAFGAALEVKRKIDSGLVPKSSIDIKEIIMQKINYDKNFTCNGKNENCDRKCNISTINLDNTKFYFGGICDKYHDQDDNTKFLSNEYNLVNKYQNLIFNHNENNIESIKTIGLNKSFLSNLLFPLYFYFFINLGFKVIISDIIDENGLKKAPSSFCYPAQISYGMFENLLTKKCDYIFLPHINKFYVEEGQSFKGERQCVCVIAQSEPYYIKSAFKDIEIPIISPVLNFQDGYKSVLKQFINIGNILEVNSIKSKKAFLESLQIYSKIIVKKKELSNKLFNELNKDKNRIGIVLFGRSYNAFVNEANYGIPEKFATRGYYIIPYDCLPFKKEKSINNMSWASGEEIIKCANYIKKNQQLFGVYITNFSCGPDSFLVTYFREIMGNKPSLTLELDSHCADAGINTRVEAFLDVIERYRSISINNYEKDESITAELVQIKNKTFFKTGDEKLYQLNDSKIKIIIPSMGRTLVELLGAAFRGCGYKSDVVKLPTSETLIKGHNNTSCKECLPYILTTASLLEYIEKNNTKNELLLYFMPTGSGSCRFSQYDISMTRLLQKKQIKNIAFINLSQENNYANLNQIELLNIYKSIIIGDIMDDIKNAIIVLAINKNKGLEIFNIELGKIKKCFENGSKNLDRVLNKVSGNLSNIKLKYPIRDAKKVLLIGEVYVRKDEFSSGNIFKHLIDNNIIVKRAPVSEWMHYIDYIYKKEIDPKFNIKEYLQMFIQKTVKNKVEKRIKKIFSNSKLYEKHEINIKDIIKTASHFVKPALIGDTILNVGVYFKEIKVNGVILTGPFTCMPTRVSEAIISKESSYINHVTKKRNCLPFISIECDGNEFPQIVKSKLEAFCLQVERVNNLMNNKVYKN